MKRLKLKHSDFWIYAIAFFVAGVFFGIFCSYCFSSPSSEARFCGLESGFLNSIGSANVEPQTIGAGSSQKTPPIQPAPTFTVTAYCPCEKCCGEFADGITASGHIIQKGDQFVAAPPHIPFGTLLTIPDYAGGLPVEVRDRGGKIRGNRLDVFFDSHDEALAWGVKHFEVEQ